ncbi:MAG: dethiobiotin synthase [Rhodospirillales bacterium]|nr:dethiobiotin synthase [Alphaproteobacteria bacterium]USO03179.1 MAG: dethiobiotin synthase [Rhodospirillales bacterium]
MKGFFVTGTDTDVGKTLASAWLMLKLEGVYWKPVQCGLEVPTDEDFVRKITQLSKAHFIDSVHRLQAPLSPHEAAKRENVHIALDDFSLPAADHPFIVEGAGGLMVPLNEKEMMIDLIERLALPAILVCRSGLGTINHTLLSLEALRKRNLPVAGLIISGPKTPHNRQALAEYGGVPIIAEIDYLDPVDRESLLRIKPEVKL